MDSQGFVVFMADIDGDGKVDYLSLGYDGSFTAWRNAGVGIPTSWESLGVVFNEGADIAAAARDNWANFRLVRVSFLTYSLHGIRAIRAICSL